VPASFGVPANEHAAACLADGDDDPQALIRPGPGLGSPSVAAMSLCPSCGSCLLQPLRSRPGKDGEMLVDLRCPECFMWMQECCSRAELAELDKRQAAWRALLVEAYERSVTESMEALAVCLGAALALDLVDADDFAPRKAA
jgi:hypothetical protein